MVYFFIIIVPHNYLQISVKGVKDYDDTFKDNRQLENNSTSINITFLHSGSQYSFEVSAVTGGGEGESVSISIDVPESG